MAPKKSANLPDEVEEIKKSLDFLSAKIKTVAAQQNKIMELMGEIQSLKIQNIEKDKKITFLENRVADLEQYTRMNDLIISGLKTRHRSYARAAVASEDTAAGRRGADALEVDRVSLEQQTTFHNTTPSRRHPQLDEERFIIEVEKHTILYDITHQYYKDNVRKDKAWCLVGGVIGVEGKY
ncbi:Laminin-like protein epi-1 [Dissostichus eleginoides]|uniref:Laminin-like protein epi-1 n=1 Tax=Dissostichus eleginoides TaxID=100907 RepID=A0AAD9CDQ7_DISEL|nr:Laminin-like protein epi-1 [Dissostichus eleginoides]